MVNLESEKLLLEVKYQLAVTIRTENRDNRRSSLIERTHSPPRAATIPLSGSKAYTLPYDKLWSQTECLSVSQVFNTMSMCCRQFEIE